MGFKILKDKNLVVTGGNRGIGKSIILEAAKEGARVCACVRNISEEFEHWCITRSRELDTDIIPIYLDLEKPECIQETYNSIKKVMPKIDGLVNNAGIVFNSLFQMTTVENMEKLQGVNSNIPLYFTQYMLKLFDRKRGGSIVNVSSSGALDYNVGRTAYNVSKAAVIAWSCTMAREVGKKNIRVNVIAPGLIETDMALMNTPKEIIEDEISKCSLKRMGKPEDVANLAVFLCSEKSSFITGQVMRIDGGI